MVHYRVPHLPGAIAEAVDQGRLDPNTPGLAALAEKLKRLTLNFKAEGERLDEIRWPVRNDAALAYYASREYRSIPERLRPLLAQAERWLGGEAISSDELRRVWHMAHAIHWGSSWPAEMRAEAEDVFGKIHTNITPEALVELDRTFAEPLADVKATELATMVISAAHTASEGWLAYYAHRRLSSPTAVSAVGAISIVAAARGKEIWTSVVAEALRLVPEPPVSAP